MKVGNVSQTVLKRSVLKQLHTKRKEILTDLSVEEMCTAVQILSLIHISEPTRHLGNIRLFRTWMKKMWSLLRL